MRIPKLFALAFLLLMRVNLACPGAVVDSRETDALWSHEKLVPWVVGVYDAKPLNAEERAQMLKRLGFRRFAYIWEPDPREIRAVDAEIQALQKHGIAATAWWFPYHAQDPYAKTLLETFRRYGIKPQLWISPAYRDFHGHGRTYLPQGWSPPKAIGNTAEEQERNVETEAERIGALAKLAAPYGTKIALYNHGGWSGIPENQIAILERLRRRGIADVGIVYAFNHVRDSDHDDTVNFASRWRRMKPFVFAVTITGVCMDDGTVAYPSQGDGELQMLRTIRDSGWRGEVGVFAGDWDTTPGPETTLRNILIGMDWLAAEMRTPGSGGPRPFPPIPLAKPIAVIH